MREFSLSDQLLNWYDHNARDMPWRISPQDRKRGVTPDPYRVWMSEIMLQQTTVAAVTAYFLRFTARWPDVTALASAEDEEVEPVDFEVRIMDSQGRINRMANRSGLTPAQLAIKHLEERSRTVLLFLDWPRHLKSLTKEDRCARACVSVCMCACV